MKKRAIIYALVDPRTNGIMYVGKTVAPRQRYRKHLTSRDANAKKLAWLDELKERGLRPVMVKLEECDPSPRVWRDREIQWMAQLSRGQQCPEGLPVLVP